MAAFLTSVILSVSLYLFINDSLFAPPDVRLSVPKIKWFGSGSRVTENVGIKEFKWSIPDQEIENLKKRLEEDIPLLTRSIEGVGFDYGLNLDYLRQLMTYWKDEYDWRKAEKQLLELPQFVTEIDGMRIHFIHSKPEPKEGQVVLPLLIVHGWPGSVVEFSKIIPILNKGNDKFAFEVIAPSIPGYGFSSAPQKTGFSADQAARIFAELMIRVGHEEFYVQGGDWGSVITTSLATFYPDNVLGLHTNFPGVLSFGAAVKKALARSFPNYFLEEDEKFMLELFEGEMKWMLIETGYLHIQATKPDTLGASLTTSPIGLAAWIMEKFFADPLHKNLGKSHWPKSVLKNRYKNIVSHNIMPRGGHFAAMEEPELLAKDILAFVAKAREVKVPQRTEL